MLIYVRISYVSLEEIQNRMVDIEDHFAAKFDEIFKKSPDDKDISDYENQYCLINYVAKFNLINYAISTNDAYPSEINLDALNCEQIVNDFVNKIQIEIISCYLKSSLTFSTMYRECAQLHFQQSQFTNSFIKATVLASSVITVEQQISEKENFIAMGSMLARKIAAC